MAPLLLALPIGLAALGAGLHPAPTKSYGAEAALGIGVGARDGLTERVVGLTAVNSIRAEARQDIPGTVEEITSRVEGDLVILGTRAATQEAASAYANTFAQRVAVLARLGPDGAVSIGDFESGLGAWDPPAGVFSTAPDDQSVSSTARFGDGALLVDCDDDVSCGPSTALSYAFSKGTGYEFTASVRPDTKRGVFVSLVAGATADDVITTEPERIGKRWRRLTVIWTPHKDRASAVVSLQVARPSGPYLVDGVAVTDPLAATLPKPEDGLKGRDLRRLERDARALSVVPARPTERISGSTANWALGGLALGGLMALAALLAGRAASRRRREDPEDEPLPREEPVGGDEDLSDDDRA